MLKPLFLIPDYNHPDTIKKVAGDCLAFGHDVLIVDDGSDENTREKIREAARQDPRIHVLRLNENSGKGGAVLAGFQWAIARGYTHAFQLDADGQQDPGAIPEFLRVMENNPEKLICGYPLYDDSVPASRKWGRKITDFWIAVNTLSFAFRDALCGFRIYPLKAVEKWLTMKPAVGLRMDFDPDIIVQLYWLGLDPVNLPVRVTYPIDGISHFKPIENLYLSKMHAINFFGMLMRLPRLIGRHFNGKKD